MADRTWQYDNNRELSDTTTGDRIHASYIWALKAFLTGQVGGATLGLWTMDQCCDSTQVKTDGTDLFGATFDASKWVFAAEGVAHSWLVLKSPNGFANGPWYLALNPTLSGSTHVFQTSNIRLSKTQPSGGTTTAAPTTTNYIANSASYQTLVDTAATGVTQRLQCILATNGDFMFLYCKNSAGFASSVFSVLHLVDGPTNDSNPLLLWLQYQGSSPGALGQNFFAQDNTNNAHKVLPPYSALSGSTGAQAKIIHPHTTGGLPTVSASGDYVDGKIPFIPAPVMTSTSGQQSVRGYLPDIRITLSTSLVQGVVSPDNSSMTFAHHGDMVVPTNVLPIL